MHMIYSFVLLLVVVGVGYVVTEQLGLWFDVRSHCSFERVNAWWLSDRERYIVVVSGPPTSKVGFTFPQVTFWYCQQLVTDCPCCSIMAIVNRSEHVVNAWIKLTMGEKIILSRWCPPRDKTEVNDMIAKLFKCLMYESVRKFHCGLWCHILEILTVLTCSCAHSTINYSPCTEQ